ncbi:hypothetical protein ACIA8C_06675 [Nocardia sp. NPDC051321]|uniref:hypothetical protein n=1 Tax=Nocardia sp. NPDC051321 TaxID=3364323 RepID=UPI0037B61602
MYELERWRDQQITRDTVTVTGFEEKFDAVHAGLGEIRASIGVLDSRIGDLGGRSVASRLISMSVDIGNLLSRQESMEARQDSMEARQKSMEARQKSMEARQESMEARLESIEARQKSMEARLATVESDVSDIKSDVAQILYILRQPNGDK